MTAVPRRKRESALLRAAKRRGANAFCPALHPQRPPAEPGGESAGEMPGPGSAAGPGLPAIEYIRKRPNL